MLAAITKTTWTRILRLSTIAFVFALAACQPDPIEVVENRFVKDYDNKVVWRWNELFLEVERYAEVYRPCPAARALGYVGLAAYESVVSDMPDYQSIANRYQGLKIPAKESNAQHDPRVVVNAVYGTMFKKFFPNVRASDLFKIASLESAIDGELSNQIPADIFRRSREYGVKVAEAVFAYSATDLEGHDKYLDSRPSNYTPPTGPGKWQPTPPGNQRAMFPYWGRVRTFAIRETDKLARPPLAFSQDRNSPFFAQAQEVYALTSPQTSEDRWIAEFWSDDVLGFTFSPPSRWIAIGNQVLEAEKANLEKAILMSMKVGLSLNDASVACWNSKFVYNIERPASYIRRNIDPNWNVAPLTTNGFLGSTPSFPAYPSGHSVFGAAAAEALSSVFGYSYSFTDRCHQERTDFNGRPRAFASFYEAANENAYSRLPLGVHFRMDAEEGVRLGYQVGRRVNELPIKK
ncbi:MAG: hypothetical protein RL757_3399 [Bacteroidota bacterium]|jgi:membrane-associated phospholipid phosphatase